MEQESMGRKSIRIRTVVRPGRRIEFAAPAEMHEGDEVDVVLMPANRTHIAARQSILDILDALHRRVGAFNSAQNVDSYVQGERDSWEQLP